MENARGNPVSRALVKMGYPIDDLGKVAERLSDLPLRRFHDGETVIKEGDGPGEAYIILKGIVDVLKHTGNGHDAKIAEGRPGCVLGEMAMLTGYSRLASVKARGEVELLVLAPRDFHLLLTSSQRFRARIIVQAARRRMALIAAEVL